MTKEDWAAYMRDYRKKNRKKMRVYNREYMQRWRAAKANAV